MGERLCSVKSNRVKRWEEKKRIQVQASTSKGKADDNPRYLHGPVKSSALLSPSHAAHPLDLKRHPVQFQTVLFCPISSHRPSSAPGHSAFFSFSLSASDPIHRVFLFCFTSASSSSPFLFYQLVVFLSHVARQGKVLQLGPVRPPIRSKVSDTSTFSRLPLGFCSLERPIVPAKAKPPLDDSFTSMPLSSSPSH